LAKIHRETVHGLLVQYIQLLNETSEAAAKITKHTSKNIATLEGVRLARSYLEKNERKNAQILLMRDPLKLSDTNVVEELLKKYYDFIQNVKEARGILEKTMSEYVWKKRIFIGLLVISILVLVASVAVIAISSCGTAVPAIIPGMVVTESVVLPGVASVAGIIGGGIGIFLASVGITSASCGIHLYSKLEEKATGMLHQLEGIKKSSEEIHEYIQELKNAIIAAQSADAHKGLILRESEGEEEFNVVVDLLLNKDRVEQIEIALSECKTLQKQAMNVRTLASERKQQYETELKELEEKLDNSLTKKNMADYF